MGGAFVKKIVATVLAILLFLICFVSCSPDEHIHTRSAWKYNDTEHWCAGECNIESCAVEDEIYDFGAHVDDSKDIICDTCGYELKSGEAASPENGDTTGQPGDDEEIPPKEDGINDEIIDSLVKIQARPDFVFRNDLTNSTSGELSTIENDYYLSAYKVTNAQYAVFVLETGHKAPKYWTNGTYPNGKAKHPVLNVSYSDAVAYCEWLSSKYEDWLFRLPTEAEWENAAMGEYYADHTVKYPNGKETPSYDSTTGVLNTAFNFNAVIATKLLNEYGSDHIVTYIKGDFLGKSETLGECISISQNGGVTNWANHGGNATKGYFLQTDLYAEISADGGYTTPVGSYAPNSLGLYDMAGNCWDITSSMIIAQNGLEQGVSCYAVRGGSWYATARSCTFYYRGEGRKDSASATVGFRVAAEYMGADRNSAS